ncbi:MAG: hypothetical protein Greene041614_557 [Parcubacteria group bacterium Greene0416_14]|nr:MAG: hypothetical protein Greene041614_557 [Parcubacteria group bacterium Greene0416_14]TSD00571.1 MAG: hypothetical protein Greene101415_792 [Parcubacteria group bacterium Greene1014_15]TSD08264.1 MAG: hypothetical protein Greene07144_246 [Parcubacteria group bacterium Greene0714_4]
MNDFDKFNPLIDPVKEAALAEMKKKALEERARQGKAINDNKAQTLSEGINSRASGPDVFAGLPAEVGLPVDSLPAEPILGEPVAANDLGPYLVEGLEKGIETLKAQDAQSELNRPKENPVKPLPESAAEKELRKDIIAHTKNLMKEFGGRIPSHDEVRASLSTSISGAGARAFSMDSPERKFFDKVYGEMTRDAFVFSEEKQPVKAPPVEVVKIIETAVSTASEQGTKEETDAAWDKIFPSSWTPERKGVVGRAAGSVSDTDGKQGEKNATGAWIFDEEFKEEKQREMEKQLAAREFEEKKKPELTALFEAEAAAADVLGHFDDAYLLKMIVDKRKNVPLDADEIALFRKLYEDRYARAPSPEIKAMTGPEELTDAEAEKREQEELDEAWRTVFDGGAPAGEETSEDYSIPVLEMTPEEAEHVERALIGDAAVPAVAEASLESASVAKDSELKKFNAIRALLMPEKDPLDPRNDRRTLVFVQMAYNEGKLGGDGMSEDLKHTCALMRERDSDSGATKAKLVEEAFALGKAIHARGEEAASTPVAPVAETTTTPAVTAAAPAEQTPPDTTVHVTPDGAPAPAPEAPRTPKEIVEEAKKDIEKIYDELSEKEREKLSMNFLNWGLYLKKWTGELMSGTLLESRGLQGTEKSSITQTAGKLRQSSPLYDAFAHRWAKSADKAQAMLSAAKLDKLKKDAGLKMDWNVGRKLQSGGVIASAAARIGRPVAAFFGLPISAAMYAALVAGEVVGTFKDYEEIKVANKTRGDEDYRKKEDESEEEYIARTSGGKTLNEAWALYDKAKNKSGGEKPTGVQIGNEYLKTLPAELIKRIEKIPDAGRKMLPQTWMGKLRQLGVEREAIVQKIMDIHFEVLNAATEEKKAEVFRRRKGALERYARLVEENGTVHSFGLAAVQVEKLRQVFGWVFTAESAWQAYKGLSHLFTGEASPAMPRAAEVDAATPQTNESQVGKTALAYQQYQEFFSGQKDKKAALEVLHKRLEDPSLSAEQKAAMTQFVSEETVRQKSAAPVEITPKMPVENGNVPQEGQQGEPKVTETTPKVKAPPVTTKQTPIIPETSGTVPSVEVVPNEVVRHMNNLPTERVISDYIADNKGVAKSLGWNGEEEELANFATNRASTLWGEYASTVLKNDTALAQTLQEKGYSPDAAGYAEYVQRDGNNAIKIDIANKKVEVVGKDYFTKDAAAHQGKHAAVVEEAEERLKEKTKTEKPSTDPAVLRALQEIRERTRVAEHQFFDTIVRTGAGDAISRTDDLINKVKTGDVDRQAFSEYYGQLTGADARTVASMQTALEKAAGGTLAEQNSALLLLRVRMQNMMAVPPIGPQTADQLLGGQGQPVLEQQAAPPAARIPDQQPAGEVKIPEQRSAIERLDNKTMFREGTSQESIYWSMKAIPLNRILDTGPGDSTERARRLLQLVMSKQLDAETFADYYAQRMVPQVEGKPRIGANERKSLAFASKSAVAEMRGMFDRYTTGDGTTRREVAVQLGNMLRGLTRRH